jgi:TonB family protein
MAYFSDRLVSANKLIIAAAVIYAGSLTFAHAAELTSAEIEALPCAGSPHASNEAEGVRLASIALGTSIENAVLRRSDTVRKHAQSTASTLRLIAHRRPLKGDKVAANAAFCTMHKFMSDELARQLSTETPVEQARIAAYAIQKKAKMHELVQQLLAAKAIEPAKASPTPSATPVQAYLSQVSDVIRARLVYPAAGRVRSAKGIVGVSFSIGPTGAPTSFAITRSWGDRDLDEAARSLVEGGRFSPPPGGSAHISTSFNYSPKN